MTLKYYYVYTGTQKSESSNLRLKMDHETVTVCEVDSSHTHRVDGFPGNSPQHGHHPSSRTGRLLENFVGVLGAVLRSCSAP